MDVMFQCPHHSGSTHKMTTLTYYYIKSNLIHLFIFTFTFKNCQWCSEKNNKLWENLSMPQYATADTSVIYLQGCRYWIIFISHIICLSHHSVSMEINCYGNIKVKDKIEFLIQVYIFYHQNIEGYLLTLPHPTSSAPVLTLFYREKSIGKLKKKHQ